MEEELSYGERTVGLQLNPSSRDPDVDAIKQYYASIIDVMVEKKQSASGEKYQLLSIAVTEAQTAQMWAVKALTWKD